MLPNLKFMILVGVLLTISYNVTRTTFEIYHSSKRLDYLKKELDKKKSENDKLKSELAFVDTSEFIEQEARNKLNMVKPGEVLVINSIRTGEAASVDDYSKTTSIVAERSEASLSVSNPEKWFNLFFGSGF